MIRKHIVFIYPQGLLMVFCRWRMIVLLTILKHLVTLKDMIVA